MIFVKGMVFLINPATMVIASADQNSLIATPMNARIGVVHRGFPLAAAMVPSATVDTDPHDSVVYKGTHRLREINPMIRNT